MKCIKQTANVREYHFTKKNNLPTIQNQKSCRYRNLQKEWHDSKSK